MLIKNQNKLIKLIDKVSGGDYCNSDAGLLLVWLRPYFNDHKLLKDLGDFIAHNVEKRFGGSSYLYIHSFVDNFIKISEKDGDLKFLGPVFDSKNVLDDLVEVIKKIHSGFDENNFRKQKDRLINEIIDFIDETEIEFTDPRVVRCYLEKNGQAILFCLNLDLNGPFIRRNPKAAIKVSLFS